MKSFISKLEKKFSKMNKDLTKLFGIHQIKDCLEHDIFINIIVTCSLCLRNMIHSYYHVNVYLTTF